MAEHDFGNSPEPPIVDTDSAEFDADLRAWMDHVPQVPIQEIMDKQTERGYEIMRNYIYGLLWMSEQELRERMIYENNMDPEAQPTPEELKRYRFDLIADYAGLSLVEFLIREGIDLDREVAAEEPEHDEDDDVFGYSDGKYAPMDTDLDGVLQELQEQKKDIEAEREREAAELFDRYNMDRLTRKNLLGYATVRYFVELRRLNNAYDDEIFSIDLKMDKVLERLRRVDESGL